MADKDTKAAKEIGEVKPEGVGAVQVPGAAAGTTVGPGGQPITQAKPEEARQPTMADQIQPNHAEAQARAGEQAATGPGGTQMTREAQKTTDESAKTAAKVAEEAEKKAKRAGDQNKRQTHHRAKRT